MGGLVRLCRAGLGMLGQGWELRGEAGSGSTALGWLHLGQTPAGTGRDLSPSCASSTGVPTATVLRSPGWQLLLARQLQRCVAGGVPNLP